LSIRYFTEHDEAPTDEHGRFWIATNAVENCSTCAHRTTDGIGNICTVLPARSIGPAPVLFRCRKWEASK
jgi:hypothetical protein